MAEPARKFDYAQPRGTLARGGNRPVKHAVKREKRRKRPAYVFEEVKTGKSIFFRILIYLIVLFGALLCVFSMAYMESRKIELAEMDRQLNRLRIENNVLRSQIHDNFDLTEVEQYAINVLGMVQPNESQFVYIDPVRLGYAVRHFVEEEEIRPFDIIGDMFRSVLKLVRTE
jgi:cell division protein FtsB